MAILVQDLLAILPMMDDLILLDVSGDMIHKVRKYFINFLFGHVSTLKS